MSLLVPVLFGVLGLALIGLGLVVPVLFGVLGLALIGLGLLGPVSDEPRSGHRRRDSSSGRPRSPVGTPTR